MMETCTSISFISVGGWGVISFPCLSFFSFSLGFNHSKISRLELDTEGEREEERKKRAPGQETNKDN